LDLSEQVSSLYHHHKLIFFADLTLF